MVSSSGVVGGGSVLAKASDSLPLHKAVGTSLGIACSIDLQVVYHTLHVLYILLVLLWLLNALHLGLFEVTNSFHFGERVCCGIGLSHDLWLVHSHTLGGHGILS